MRREDSGASAAPPWIDATHSCLKSAASCLAGECARSRRAMTPSLRLNLNWGGQHQRRDSLSSLTSEGLGAALRQCYMFSQVPDTMAKEANPT